MSYRRVIPRDLFNEASLLKCLGQLYIQTEKYGNKVVLLHTGSDFYITQDQDDGSIRVGNITIIINQVTYDHFRPLNSREPWPLWLRPRNDPDGEELEAFETDGTLSPHLAQLIQGIRS